MSPRVAIAPTVFSFARIVCKLHIHPYLDHELPVGCSAFISVWSNIVPHLHRGVRHLSKWNEKKIGAAYAHTHAQTSLKPHH